MGGLLPSTPSKRLLRGVDHVEEAVLIPLALIHLGNGRRDRDHAMAVYQQEEGLVGVKLQAPPGGQTWNNTEQHNYTLGYLSSVLK